MFYFTLYFFVYNSTCLQASHKKGRKILPLPIPIQRLSSTSHLLMRKWLKCEHLHKKEWWEHLHTSYVAWNFFLDKSLGKFFLTWSYFFCCCWGGKFYVEEENFLLYWSTWKVQISAINYMMWNSFVSHTSSLILNKHKTEQILQSFHLPKQFHLMDNINLKEWNLLCNNFFLLFSFSLSPTQQFLLCGFISQLSINLFSLSSLQYYFCIASYMNGNIKS